MNVAIISPSFIAYSETFIQQHKKINENVFYYYGGSIPRYLEGYGKIKISRTSRLKKLIKKQLSMNTVFSLQENAVAENFQKNNINVVLAEYGPTAVAILKICKQLNIPLVAHFHGYDASERTTIEKFGKSYRELFNYAAAVVAVSNKMITDLNNLGCAKEKIYLSPCGPSADFFQVKPLTNKKQFVAIGRFVEKKAPHLTLAAFKIVNEKHPDSNLVMIGEGELLSVCKHFAELWGMKNKVEFRGIQTADNIRITLSESIAFVQHSVVALNGDSEGTPVAVMEASAASLPVIATKHAGINDVIVNGQTGFLVEEKDVNSMAEYMIRIIEQPDLARKMGEAGRKNIKENFSLEKNLSELKQILKKAATI